MLASDHTWILNIGQFLPSSFHVFLESREALVAPDLGLLLVTVCCSFRFWLSGRNLENVTTVIITSVQWLTVQCFLMIQSYWAQAGKVGSRAKQPIHASRTWHNIVPGSKRRRAAETLRRAAKILYESWSILSWNTNLIFVFATMFWDQIQSSINKKKLATGYNIWSRKKHSKNKTQVWVTWQDTPRSILKGDVSWGFSYLLLKMIK